MVSFPIRSRLIISVLKFDMVVVVINPKNPLDVYHYTLEQHHVTSWEMRQLPSFCK
jgi:hypothetical protein